MITVKGSIGPWRIVSPDGEVIQTQDTLERAMQAALLLLAFNAGKDYAVWGSDYDQEREEVAQ